MRVCTACPAHPGTRARTHQQTTRPRPHIQFFLTPSLSHAGAIQDHDRGIIMGDTTYGKGLVQQLQRLGQGGQQIKFTIGKYYTPSGRCIQV